MEKPTKDDFLKGLDQIDTIIRQRLDANPDASTVDALLEIRKVAQDLVSKVLILFKPSFD